MSDRRTATPLPKRTDSPIVPANGMGSNYCNTNPEGLNEADISCLWNTLYRPEDVIELRAPNAGKNGTVSGYFDNPDALMKAARQWDGQVNVYFTVNPVNPALLARCRNRAETHTRTTTSDSDIPHLRWLLIDIDARRPAGISASDAEHANALALANEVREFLDSQFGIATVYADSGNGGHLLLPLDLPNEQANRDLLKAFLAGLAFRFDTAEANIDRTTYNPARICKLYGTLAVKGDSTPDRPHRRARLLDAPETLIPVSIETLREIAALSPEPEPMPKTTRSGTAFNLRAFMDNNGLEIHAVSPCDGGTRYQLVRCPFNAEHGPKDAAIFEKADGKIGFKCFHSSCSGKCWSDVRELLEPGYQEERERKKREFDSRSGYEKNERNEETLSESVKPGVNSYNSFNSSSEAPEKIDEAAYYGLAGEFVRRVEPHTESDSVALLIQFLVAFGNVIGRNPYYLVESTRHYMNTFAVIVGKSAKARKGTSLNNVLDTFRVVDSAWYNERIQSGLSSGEGMIHAVRDPLEVEEDMKEKGRVVGRQIVVKDGGVEDKRLLVKEAEFARPLKVMEREGSTLSSLLRDSWDDGKLRVMTKTPQKATGAHISIIGHITQDELRRLLTDTDAANGFANRFLWIYAERSKLLPEGGSLWREDMTDLHTRLGDAVRFASTVERMHRDSAARAMWATVYPELTREVPGLLGSITARADAHTLRLSCLFALLDQSAVVRTEHLEAALAIWNYAEESARHIFGDALGDPVADEILRALRNSPTGLNRTEISAIFGRNVKTERIAPALQTLTERRLAVCEVRTGENGGRPTEWWYALPEGAK